MRLVVLPVLAAILCTVITVANLTVSEAQVMQSTSYQIQSDTINVGGGLSSSTNYISESTFGEVATGDSDSASYSVNAGFQQMQAVFISLSGAGNVSMTPAIPGVTGGVANGSTTVTVITDSPSGYALTIKAEGDPAMQKGADTIADYAPGVNPEFTFTTDAGEAHFGFSPEGGDIVQRYQDDGGSCNTSSLDTSLSCWDGLSTSEETIASDTSPNHPTGATTTVHFRVGVGGAVNPSPGFYTATTTITALPL